MNQHPLLYCTLTAVITAAIILGIWWLVSYFNYIKRFKIERIKNRRKDLEALRKLDTSKRGMVERILEEVKDEEYTLTELDPTVTVNELEELRQKMEVEYKKIRIKSHIEKLSQGSGNLTNDVLILHQLLKEVGCTLADFGLDDTCWKRFEKASHLAIGILHRSCLRGSVFGPSGIRSICHAAKELKKILTQGKVTEKELELVEVELAFIKKNG